MAFVKCKNCGKMISDKAVTCPQCNAQDDLSDIQEDITLPPIIEREAVMAEELSKSHTKMSLPLIMGIVSAVIIIFGGGIYWLASNGEKQTSDVSQGLETQRFEWKNPSSGDSKGLDVFISVDYPIGSNKELDNSIRQWINEQLGGSYTQGLEDGQAVCDYYGEQAYQAARECQAYFDGATVNNKYVIRKIYENNGVVTYLLNWDSFGMNDGILSQNSVGQSFNKQNGLKLNWSNMFTKLNSAKELLLAKILEMNDSDYSKEELSQTVQYISEQPRDFLPYYIKEGICFPLSASSIFYTGKGNILYTVNYDQIGPYLTDFSNQ